MACNVDFLAMIGDADNKPDDEEIFDKVRWQSNVTIFLYYTLILGLPYQAPLFQHLQEPVVHHLPPFQTPWPSTGLR